MNTGNEPFLTSIEKLWQEYRVFRAMLQEYGTLRNEIIRCIKHQHRVLVVESAAILGAVVAMAIKDNLVQGVIFIGIPPVFIVLTSLWVIEQSRMMRAGNYLQCLEVLINRELGKPHLFWENWLRQSRPRISAYHYLAQTIGVFGILIVMDIIGIVGMLWTSDRILPGQIGITLFTILAVIYISTSIFVIVLVFLTLVHKQQPIEEFMTSREKIRR
ncbi:MAG: hypothetical protein A2Z21_06135 [Candidatus Fraserbacteria bacterium RBG_16_55_9]|uniref:Uncharacterized protein n=1 Tax=Fraserbacteria sp. (strain RBG_16_55_9) TaxID=1817864 RepID=A0A1F5V2S2_FRAXR|nr:MAG: hypothetical protein A2Z21_06135 [Candidatus Fraserbacteria bacterium RBG_16_55_9]